MNRYPGEFGKFARSVQNQLARAQQSGAGAVSYTHLDVYKRQTQYN